MSLAHYALVGFHLKVIIVSVFILMVVVVVVAVAATAAAAVGRKHRSGTSGDRLADGK